MTSSTGYNFSNIQSNNFKSFENAYPRFPNLVVLNEFSRFSNDNCIWKIKANWNITYVSESQWNTEGRVITAKVKLEHVDKNEKSYF